MKMRMMAIVSIGVVLAAIAWPCVAATPEAHPWSGKKVVYLGDSGVAATQGQAIAASTAPTETTIFMRIFIYHLASR